MGKKKATAAGASSSSVRKLKGGWERSVLADRDLKQFKQHGFISNKATNIRFPGDEVVPAPEPGWRVAFSAFFFRGLSFPLHEFFRGLLFIYGIHTLFFKLV